MSEAVREALAARRAAKASLTFAKADFIQPFGTPKGGVLTLPPEQVAKIPDLVSDVDTAISQRPEGELLFKSCWNGRLNLSSRQPACRSLPSSLFTLLDADAPQWYEDASEKQGERRAWYERQDLETLVIANGEVDTVDDKLAEFASLVRLDLHNNRITSLPPSLLGLKVLTALNLSHNSLTSVPPCLLSLDTLVELNLSHNKIDTLWTDDLVLQSRTDRDICDRQSADEGQSSVLLARSGKPAEQQRPGVFATVPEPHQPMRSLRNLNLAHNRLGNAALGLSGDDVQSTKAWSSWPPSLVELDLSDNFLRGPLPLSFVGLLPNLAKLALGGNALKDDLFAPGVIEPEDIPSSIFPALQVLDVQRCEIDDLQQIEEIFGSGRTIFASAWNGVVQSAVAAVGTSAPATGIEARQLMRLTSSDAPTPSLGTARYLGIILEGNVLQGETFKRKAGAASNFTAHTFPKSNANPKEKSRQAFEAPAGGSGTLSQPVRHEGGINRTGLSEWDGTPVMPPRRSRVGFNDLGSSNGEHFASASRVTESAAAPVRAPLTAGRGSTLASAKLTKRQSEALGRVPCKFFRSSGGCSAGPSCPFAHVPSGSGLNSNGITGSAGADTAVGGKAVCEYFLKGNCRYGTKCLLVHVRDGEPLSSDRKNKRAAQAGPRVVSGQQYDTKHVRQQESSRAMPWARNYSADPKGQLDEYDFVQYPPQHTLQQCLATSGSSPPPPRLASSEWGARGHLPASRTDDFAFGIPDDLQQHIYPDPSARGLSHPANVLSAHGHQSTSTFIGSPPSTSAFGSSPFANEQSVFYSSSQELESLASRPLAQASSYTRTGEKIAGAGTGFQSRSFTSRDTRQGRWFDISDDRDDSGYEIHNEEDFLPSSLSDLLTPAELQRRQKNNITGFSGSLVNSSEMCQTACDAQTPGHQFIAAHDFRLGFDRKMAAISHAPGQSLPRGLAAGLSSLYLTSSPEQRQATVPTDWLGQASSGLASVISSSGAISASLLARQRNVSSMLRPVGSPRESSILNSWSREEPLAIVDAHGLGPTAPSSFLPHRAPGGFQSRLLASGDVVSSDLPSKAIDSIDTPSSSRSHIISAAASVGPHGPAVVLAGGTSSSPSSCSPQPPLPPPPSSTLRTPHHTKPAGTTSSSSRRTWSTGTGMNPSEQPSLAFGAAGSSQVAFTPQREDDLAREDGNDEVGLFELE